VKYHGDFWNLIDACERVSENWGVDEEGGNAFGDSLAFARGLDGVESLVHELCHWFSLGHTARPIKAMTYSNRMTIQRMSASRADDEEARAIAIEFRVFKLLGLELSRREERELLSFAAGGMSVTTRDGRKLIRRFVEGKQSREVRRCAKRVAQVIREELSRPVEEVA
jgi:hypothetical protein